VKSWFHLVLALVAGVLVTFAIQSACGPDRGAEIDSLITAEKAQAKIDSAVAVERQRVDSLHRDSVKVLEAVFDSTRHNLMAEADSLRRARGRTRGAGAGVETPGVPPRLPETPSDSASLIASLERENEILRRVVTQDTAEIRRGREESARAWARVRELEVESADKSRRITVLVKALEDVRTPCFVTSVGGSVVVNGGVHAGPAIHAGVRLGCLVDFIK
jgi:hypothetical protein